MSSRDRISQRNASCSTRMKHPSDLKAEIDSSAGLAETNVPFRIRNRGCRLKAQLELRRCSASGFRRDHDAALRCAAFSTDRAMPPCRQLGEPMFRAHLPRYGAYRSKLRAVAILLLEES